MSGPSVIVIGGGIAGLAAAHRLSALCGGELMLLESSPQLGGKVRAVELGGQAVDAGPDSFLTRNPAAMQLCTEIGLASELVAPAALGAMLWVRGRLRRLPRDLALGVPREMKGLALSGAISPWGVARAALEGILPVRAPDRDLSVGELVRPRFGNEVFEAVIDPLLSGIYAGNADRLSAEVLVPHLVDALRRGKRLASLQAPKSSGPAFLTLRGGLSQLVDAVAATLPRGSVRLGETAVSLSRRPGGYRVELSSGAYVESDAVVIATPPRDAAMLLQPLSNETANLIGGIESVPVATVALKYPSDKVSLPAATGFLVPRQTGRLMVGCTFVSQKWPHHSSAAQVIRCAVGRDGAAGWQTLDDAELVRAVQAELRDAAGIAHEPAAVAVSRFQDGIPQYRVGHGALVERIEASLAAHRGIAVAGAAYHGVGLPACVASGARAAEQLAATLRLVAA